MPPDEGTSAAAAAAGTETTQGAAAGAATTSTTTAEQQVPYSRFKTQGDALKAAQERAAALEGEIAQLRPAAQAATAFRQQAATAEAKYESHFLIAQTLGQFEPDIIGTVESKITALPEAERALGLKAILDGWKADPTKAPPSVRPHFQAPAQRQETRTVDQHKNVVQANGSPGTPLTAQDLMSMSNDDYIAHSNAERAKRGLPLHPTKRT